MTHGQLKNGKRISYQEFENEVLQGIQNATGEIKRVNSEIKKQYNKGVSVDDAVSYFLMK